jgi:hypothetical protein
LVERTFRLEGPEGLGAKPRPELIGPVLSSLRDSLQDAVRMAFLHSSRARGRVPGVLRAASDVRLAGIEGDGTATLLHFELAPVGVAAAELFKQRRLWDDGPQPEQTAFEFLGAALFDVASRKADSTRFDTGLLNRIRTYRRFVSHGVDRILMPDTRLAHPGQVDRQVVEAAGELLARTPDPRRVRVVGRLDVMAKTEGILKLVVVPGQVVTVLWDGEEPIESLKDLFDRDVLVEGSAVFRPSGQLLRIDADVAAAARPEHAFFRTVPRGATRRDYKAAVRLRPGEKSVYARILGVIPAEESDDDFLAAIDALS